MLPRAPHAQDCTHGALGGEMHEHGVPTDTRYHGGRSACWRADIGLRVLDGPSGRVGRLRRVGLGVHLGGPAAVVRTAVRASAARGGLRRVLTRLVGCVRRVGEIGRAHV